jgi:hypothetical protein
MEGAGGKLSLLRRVMKNPRVLSALTAGCMIAFGVMYVGQVNSAATKGYAIRDLRARNVELRHERDRLDMQIAKLRSVQSVKTREAFLGLRPLAPSAFVKVGSEVVAVR